MRSLEPIVARRARAHAQRRRRGAVEPETVGAALALAIAGLVVLGSGWIPLPGVSTGDAVGLVGERGAHPPPLRPHGGASVGTPPPPTANGSIGGTGTGSGSGSPPSGSDPNGSANVSGPGGLPGGSGPGGTSYPGVNGSFSFGSALSNVTPAFFQLVLQTPNLTKPWLWSQLNATPFRYYEFGNAAETTDQITNIPYADNGTALPPSQSNDSNFVVFCRAVRCHAIMAVPTEIDNTTEAVATVQYVEQTLGFHPDYWMLGGEPQGWTHYGIPWAQWSTSDQSNITPLAYAREVQRYVTALRSYDPTIQMIGIESADGGKWFNSSWLDEVAAVDGPNLTALAIHPYPDGMGTTNASLASFFQSVTNPLNFPNNYPGLVAHVHAFCGCTLPLWVGEYNAGLPGNYSADMSSYPEVPYMAAGLAGAMKAGVPQVEFFAYSHGGQALVNATGSPLPSYTLFATVLANLTLGTVWNSSVLGGPTGVVAVSTSNGSRTSILLANTNLTAALNLTLTLPAGPLTIAPWQAWSWDLSTVAPVRSDGADYVPLTWTLAPEGILLINLD